MSYRTGASDRKADSQTRHMDVTIDVSQIVLQGDLNPRLYSDIAEELARQVGSSGSQQRKNRPSQLRRFYDELVMLQSRVGSSADSYSRQAPFIQMLKAKVAYAHGRDKVDSNFEKLLRRVVDEAVDAPSLARAKLFMEAFMAFYKVYGPAD